MKKKPRFTAAILAGTLTVSALPARGDNIVCAADTNIVINEVCSQNKNILTDSYGEYSD